jgi:DNA-binding response OmpR family regulator/anti-anti-sigma regulatory factor
MSEIQPESSALVLVADDDPSSIDLLLRSLAFEGMEIAIANDGEEVLEMVGREEPDLILLDVQMPVLDGFETCKRLKASPETRGIPVMFMTSLADVHHRVHGFSVGAVDYVTKPFHEPELLARVRTQLSLRSAMRALKDATRALEEKNALLSGEIQQRVATEQALAEVAQGLVRRTEELREANAQLSQELRQRERVEAARMALQEQVIAVQQEKLLELSTPLIPITDEILVMPLIGTMDVGRAGQAIETALRGAGERGGKYLIIDLTGVKTVDETVANMLVQTVQTARGLRLLGTRAVITGIRPEVAQTLIRLTLHLGGLVTKATLQAGVKYALRARPSFHLRAL